MLFAQEHTSGWLDAALWVALATAASAVIGALAAAWVNVYTKWFQTGKERRADAIAEWKDHVDKLKAWSDARDAAQQVQINGLTAEVFKLHDKHARCEQESAELRGELKVMQLGLRRLQASAGDEAPDVITAGILVADVRGMIRVASPALTPVLHYLPADLAGKNVEVIVPERLRAKYRAGLARVVSTSMPPDPGKTVVTHALTKEGREVPVTVNVSGWQTEKGEWLLTAEIRKRVSLDDPASGILRRVVRPTDEIPAVKDPPPQDPDGPDVPLS